MNQKEYLIPLDAARIRAGLTQKEAALLLGVHQQTLSAYEKDSSKIKFALLEKIEELYKIPLEDIFLGEKFEFIRTNFKIKK